MQVEVVGRLPVIVVHHAAPILWSSAIWRVVTVIVRRPVVAVNALRLLCLLRHVECGLRRRHILTMLVDVLHRLRHGHGLLLLMVELLLVGIATGRTGAVCADWGVVGLRKMGR